jgi:hypothetical protein
MHTPTRLLLARMTQSRRLKQHRGLGPRHGVANAGREVGVTAFGERANPFEAPPPA